MRTRVAGLAVTLLVVGLGLVGGPAAVATADTAPNPGTPATVSADALPTWQVNGVVWSQAVVGNTVYVTGKFATARPPGVAVGGLGEVAVGNLFAYDIRTGQPVAGFDHTLNAQGLVLHVSQDGKRLYVGGDFTTVDGVPRGHIAAFDLATGALVPSFAPALDGKVQAITTSGPWVYVGGGFFHVGTLYRQRLAALAAVNGGVSMAWAPTASTSDVRALLMSPDRSKVIIGGSFLTLSGVTANGMGAVDPISGGVLPWAASSVIKDYDNGGITSLTTDGTSVFGSGFAFGTGGTFEGSFSLNPADGSINWVADCLGDTYSTFPATDVLYSVGHAHNCSVINAFPDTSPRVRWQRALAMTKVPTQTITKLDAYKWNFIGQRAPSVLHWFPSLEDGKASGQSQAAWSVVGTTDYVALGGEFPLVNNSYQQGLTRFAIRALAPNKARPRFDVLPAKVVPTTAVAVRPGVVRLTYGSAWDRDNETLTYDVYRDGTTLVNSSTLKTNFWTTPLVGVTDRGVPVGNHTYQVKVTDPLGNTNWTTVSNAVTVPAATSGYANAVLANNPTAYWRLGESQGPTGYDFTGNGYDATGGPGVTWGATGGSGDGDAAVTLAGTAASLLPSANPSGGPVAAPASFSLEAWFRTTATNGGELIGFGDRTDGSSTVADRNLYLDDAGHVLFGVNPGVKKVVASSQSYNDGQWHHAVAALGPVGQSLYVDGVQVGRDVTTTSAAAGVLGQWVLGGDTLTGWPSAPTSRYFSGSLDDVAVYPSALGLDVVRAHYRASGRTLTNLPPTAAFVTKTAGRTLSVDAKSSSDPDGPLASYSWTFGDGATASGATVNHTYAAPGSYVVTLTVADPQGATAATTQTVTVVNAPPTAAFTTSAAALAVTVDASPSSDPDGTVSSYAWDFGDGSTGTGRTTTHTYSVAGTFPIKLTVADDSGATATVTRSITVLPANQAPVAAFTASAAGDLTASMDASGSSDPDGTIAGYAWAFGDSTTGSGRMVTHRFPAPGTYSVVLTVTDDRGATTSATRQVLVNGPFALDSFGRTVSSGWGSSEAGGAWSLLGSTSLFSVTGGTGVMRNVSAGGGAAAHLASVSSLDTDLAVDVALDRLPTGGGEFVSVTSRGTFSDAYRAKVQVTATGGVVVSLVKVVANTETVLVTRSVTGLTVAPGAPVSLRLQTWGTAPAMLRVKVWQAGTAEPGAWVAEATDSTASLQVPGGIGLRTYLSGSATNAPLTTSFDNLVARPTGN
ncbi:PKD domain-containing protein [Pedococcus sp. KACC 23699]|uniref:PKD domain-containing protein n=1 Tax=Pedococcus sp. KACC 23699 TaxID=3149228 RepID=A0AAU7JX89_9MICO